MKLTKKFGKARVRQNLRRRLTVILAGIIVFTTTYALVLPAITLDESAAADEPGIVLNTSSEYVSEEISSLVESGEESALPADDFGENAAEEDGSEEEASVPDESSEEGTADGTDIFDAETPAEESLVDVEPVDTEESLDDAEPDEYAELIEDTGSIENIEPTEDAVSADDAVPAEDVAAVEDITPPEDVATAEDMAAVEDMTPPEEPADETSVPAEVEYRPEQSFEAQAGDVRVVVYAPEGAFPDGTVMTAVPVEDEDILTAASEAVEGEVRSIQAVDIVFRDRDGTEIEPQQPVRVSMSSAVVGTAEEIQIVHVDGEGLAEVVEQAGDAESAEDEVIFEAGGFSVYVLIETETITTRYLSADGTSYEVTVTFDEEAGIPKDAVLLVSELTAEYDGYNAYVEQSAAAIGSDVSVLEYIKLLDISITDKDGGKIVPAAPVNVQIRLLDAGSSDDDIRIVHFAEDEEARSVEPELLENTGEGDTVAFRTNGFSAYAIVQGPPVAVPGWVRLSSLDELRTLANKGLYIGTTGNYYLTNTTADHTSTAGLSGIKRSSAAGNIPTSDAALYYFESAGEANLYYIYCYDDDNNKVYVTCDDPSDETQYSIRLTSDELQKKKCLVQNTNGNFRFRLNSSNNQRLHLQDNIFEARNSDTNFYIWNHVDADQDSYGLDGKTYGLMYWVDGTMGKAMMSSANGTAGHLDALPLTVMSKPNNGKKLYVPDSSDISFWTFRFIDTDTYYLTTVVDGSTKYLRIAADGLTLVSVPDDNCIIRVVPGTGNNAGKLSLTVGNKAAAYSGNVDSGFQAGGTAGSEWFNLVEESELDNTYFMTYSASKVSVSDESVTNGSRIIVYTRVWNEETKKYEFYAIDHDGSLVRCYESGDSIEWVGGRLNSMLWSFIEYYWEGTSEPNHYYDLYNQYSETYLGPQKSDGQILSDEAVGVNLNGRRNGLYYTPIVAWDEGFYSYAGLKADTASGTIVSCPYGESDDFYFAIVQDIPIDDELTTVATVDHTQYGITMKMVNFGEDFYSGNDDGNVRASMTRFLGSNNTFVNFDTESGLLDTKLGDNGYPVTKADNNMAYWFENAQEVNHLFIDSTHSATGYFEYDSVQNFAHLDPDTHDFVVYKELGCDSLPSETHRHGLFFPYNDIKAGIFAANKNTTNIAGKALPESDPRKYETMYMVQKANTEYAPDYCFGMEVTATFTQTTDGLDDWGHDIIYEFTGDDDFWLFVDGELILDLGGIHSAIPGSVNFRTGAVNVNGKSTTLREQFENNYRDRNTGATDEEVTAYLDGIFDGEIFKDYTTHTMKIYYLERGRGSSNLHMRFNLASIKPGTVQLTKQLSGVDTMETVLAEFPYQILYRTQTGDEGPVVHYLTNSTPTDPDHIVDHVFYKDSMTPCTYRPSVTIAGKTYNDVFILKPGETVDISFPTETFSENTKFLDYSIIECGLDTTVFTGVEVNGGSIVGTAVVDDQGQPIENRKDYGIDYAAPDERARVVYDNTVSPDAITDLSITKWLFDVTGENKITEEDDRTTFDFRLYLATESGSVDDSPANMHTYHVKDPGGNYCRWSTEQGRLISMGAGKSNFATLTEEEREAATFHTSMNGSISKIPVGYTIEIRDLLVGTQFKVVERPNEIPDGYSFQRYAYNGTDYRDAAEGVSDVIVTGNPSPHVVICNIKGFGLRVNKIWADADYMEDRAPVYFGIYWQDDSGGLQLVSDSLRELAYSKSSIYWYYDRLPVDGVTDFAKYHIYEVHLTDPVVDAEGKVTDFDDARRIDNGGSVSLSGRLKGDIESEFTYTVSYERGESSLNDNVRVDVVTNSRPGIILRKTKWDRTSPLAGAVFTLTDEGGNTIGRYTSGEDGLITEAFLRDGGQYTLTEISSPQSYHGLEAPMVIILNGDAVTVTGVDSSYYGVGEETGSKVITVHNRPYEFRVVKMDKDSNSPLANVRFKLYREIVVDGVHAWDPNPYPGYENLTSRSDGVVQLLDNTLPPGRYLLREISPLSGYQALSGPVTFTVSGTGVIEKSGSQPEEAEFMDPVVQADGSILYQITVTNSKVYKVSIWKTNEEKTVITSGAGFSLYRAEDYDDETGAVAEGAVPIVSGSTGINGILSLGSLTVGEYRLIETKAPDGYIPLTSAVKIFVRNSGVTAMQGTSQSEVYKRGNPEWVNDQDSTTLQIRVWNNPGIMLPHTGGSGTLSYTLGGLALIIAAALIYGFRLRRRERRLI